MSPLERQTQVGDILNEKNHNHFKSTYNKWDSTCEVSSNISEQSVAPGWRKLYFIRTGAVTVTGQRGRSWHAPGGDARVFLSSGSKGQTFCVFPLAFQRVIWGQL